MKFFKNILLIIALTSINCMNARSMGGAAQAARPVIPPQPIPVANKPVVQSQPIMQPISYAQALTMIKTKMQPHEVINNNIFTQRFIESVKSLNLSAIETKALLEAGANIHTQWDNDNTINKQILLSLNNQIQQITQNNPPPAQPIQPAPQIKPITPVQPVKPIAPNKPAQPIVNANVPNILKIGTTDIKIIKGDITKQKVDAIVNAANENLRHGGGVANAIAQAAGPALQQYSDAMPIISNGEKCPTGQAVITPAFKLTKNVGIKNIIHAVGPHGTTPNKEILLHEAYQNSLKIAKDNGLRSIAFPAISTAIFGYNIDEATPIAFAAVRDFIKMNPNAFDEIRFILFSDNGVAVYKKWINELLK